MDGAGEEKPFDLFDDALGIDSGTSLSHPSSSRGVSRFQPKVKGKVKAEPIDAPLPPRIPLNKEEPKIEVPAPAPVATSAPAPASNGFSDEDPISLMDIDGGEDCVIKEIDVFLNPSLDDQTKLYVMQYPLRPSWRPYEVNEKSKVKIDARQSKLEVDLNLDVGVNYDEDAADPLFEKKVTLSSSEVPFATQYAVGVLVGDKLYLNPLDRVVQFRPSMAHANSDGLQKKKKIVQDWVYLDCHAKGSPFSGAYQQRMVAEVHDPMQFVMSPSDYINSLCPVTSSDAKNTKGLSRRNLLLMPLEERLKKWFCEGPQINRFNALMHLAPNESINEVLKVIQQYADLVQGLWITKSSLLFKEEQARVRDYFLFLLSKNHVVPSSKITGTKFGEVSYLKEMMSQLAVKGPTNDWKLKHAPDSSFIERFPNIIKEQECAWSSREMHFLDLSAPVGKDKVLMTKSSLDSSGGVSRVANRSNDVSASTRTNALSIETRECLPKVVQQILRSQKVSSPKAIVQGLRELAKVLRAKPKDDRRYVAVSDAAVYAAKASFSELQVVLNQVAINIHGVYVAKSMGNSSIDPLRDVVIALFCHKEPQAKLKKQEVQQAAQIRLKRDITENEYSLVMKDLCDSKNGGVWVLKNGDRSPN
ncbi:DNA-directed RNA polymerase III subunit Rpc5 protein [Dioscorea alata]|uniref:DNA-directed RNA polymerase III subunit Rpc5 protein n=1 Tax=Dioscorea alata TaxID=55571 RepID=A0ACB7UHT0_DIOAL|nr:DNA-directed RNA polymerase III subunit Rpc5 protein [Dioscorea alata]